MILDFIIIQIFVIATGCIVFLFLWKRYNRKQKEQIKKVMSSSSMLSIIYEYKNIQHLVDITKDQLREDVFHEYCDNVDEDYEYYLTLTRDVTDRTLILIKKVLDMRCKNHRKALKNADPILFNRLEAEE